MKKRIFIFLTLLIACFGLFSVISNNKVTYAADEVESNPDSTVSYDLSVINVPETAIISFPVTYESAYGNEITWTVQQEQTAIQYDGVAHWMVVNRSTETDANVDVTVTVTGNGEGNFASKTFSVKVPKGITAAPSYTVNFVDNDNDDTNNLEPLTYKLGDATIDLNVIRPAANGTKVFKGWYTTEDFKEGTKLERILVGSMENYTLYAKWEDLVVTSIEITSQPTNKTYTAQQTFDKTGLVVMAHYNDGNSEDVTSVAEYSKTVLHVGDESVVVSFGNKTAIITGIDVNPITFDLGGITFESASKVYNGKAQSIDYSGELPEGLSAEVQGSATNVSEGEVNINLVFSVTAEGYENYPNDYEVPATKTVQLTITKATNNVVSEPVLEGWTYGSVANTPSASATFGEIKYTYSTTVDGGYTETVPTNAGTYYVKASVADTENYKGAEATKEFTIGKKALTLTTDPQTIKISEAEELTWEFTPTGLVDGDNLASIIGNTITAKYYIDEVETALMAGKTYEVRFTGTTYENYEITINNSSLSISKEDLYFAYENFENVVYDGSNKMFSVKAYAENGVTDILIDDAEISIKLDDSNFTGATEAGIYTVVVSIDSPSYGTLSETKSFEIEKATIDLSHVTLTGGTVKYTGSNQAIKVVGLDNEKVNVVYNITEAINVNTYNFTATFSSNDNNYKVNVESLNATLVIEKASNAISGLTIAGWTYGEYDAEENKPSASATFGTVVYTYSNALEGDYTSEVPTNVGTYYVKASVEGNDNYEGAVDTKSFEIGKATIDLSHVTLTGGTVKYTGSNQAIKVVGLDNEKVNVVYNITEAINVNTYNFTATFSSNDNNYKVNVESLNATLVIEKASNAISGLTIAGWTYGEYDAEENKPSASATFGTVVYTYSNALEGDYTSEVPTNVGTYYVKASVEGNDNYEGAVDTKSFEIAQKVLTQGNVQITVLGSDYNTSVSSTLKPGVTVMYGEKEITTYDELVYTYADESKVGQAKITITFNGNYSGTVYAYFEVTKYGQAGVDAQGLPTINNEADLLAASPLPKTIGEGTVKSNVTWRSSNTAVAINPETGIITINKAPLTEDTTVTLTALVTYGETSAYTATYEIVITKAPDSETITSGNVTIVDAPYGYDIEAEEVSEENNANYITAVESNEGYEYVTAYDITMKNELGESAQPGKTVVVRIAGTFDTSKNYKVYYVNGELTEEMTLVEVTETYVSFETDHFSVYAIAVEKEEVEEEESLFDISKEYVIITYRKSSGEYHYLTNDFDTSKNRFNSSLCADMDATTALDAYIWIIEFDSKTGFYYIKSKVDNKYIASNGDDNKASYVEGENKEALLITESTEVDGAYIINSTAISTRYLELNNTSGYNYFAFYKGTQSGDLYIKEVKSLTPAEKLASDMNELSDFTYPTTEGFKSQGTYGTDFTWSVKEGSSEYFTIENGKVINVTRPAVGEDDVEVTMTVSGTLDGTSPSSVDIVVTIEALPEPIKLATPVLTVSGNVVSWDVIENAQSYAVIINGADPISVEGNSHDLSDREPSDYTVQVIAVGDGVEYVNSDGATITLTVTEPSQGGNNNPATTWTLVTNVSQLQVGDQIIIVAKDADVALSTTQNGNNRGAATVTKSDNTVSFGDDVQVLTIENGSLEGTLAFNTGSGYLYAASSSKNYLKTQTTLTEAGSWTILITDGIATIKAPSSIGRNWMRFNPNNGSPIFSCYGSGQQDIQIYKSVQSSN